MAAPAMVPIKAEPAYTPQIVLENVPSAPSAARTANDAVRLLTNILVYCKCSGTWRLRFVKGIAGRGKSRFTLRRIDTDMRGVRISLRPGDNSTRWEWLLIPPGAYDLAEVAKELSKTPTSAKLPRVFTPNVQAPKAVAPKTAQPAPATSTAVSTVHIFTELDLQVFELAKMLGLTTRPVQIPGCQIYACFVPISPEMSHRWMVEEKRNEHNRSLNMRTVARYCKDMQMGYWVDTPQGIMFNLNGELLDGQNRLRAIFESYLTVPTMVFLNVPDEARRGIDNHRVRTPIDSAVLWATDLRGGATAARRFIIGPSKTPPNLSTSELCDTISRHAEAFSWMKEKFAKKSPSVSTAPVMAAAARAYYYVDHAKLNKFVETMYSCQTTRAVDHACMLYKKLRDTKLLAHEQYCFATKAIHLYTTDSTIARLHADTADRYALPPDGNAALARKQALDAAS